MYPSVAAGSYRDFRGLRAVSSCTLRTSGGDAISIRMVWDTWKLDLHASHSLTRRARQIKGRGNSSVNETSTSRGPG